MLRSLGCYIYFHFIVPQSCVEDLRVIPLNLSTFTCKMSSFVCGSGIRAYEQLGYRAFGTPGKMAAGIAITLQNIGGEVTLRSSVLTPGFCPQRTPASVYFNLNECLCLLPAAMSSYLYIVKYEFPLVIQAFLKVDNPAG